MPLSPKDVSDLIKERFDLCVIESCHDIDEVLRSYKIIEYDKNLINLEKIRHWPLTKDSIIEAYRDVGWDVSFDEEYLILKINVL